MEETNENQQKKLRIKINPFTTMEEVQLQLEEQQQYDEIKFTIKRCTNGNDFLLKIMNQVSHYNTVLQFKLKIEDFIDLSFDSFYKFQNYQSLTHFVMNFNQNIHINPNQNYKLGECLKDLKNLTQLELCFDCKYLTNQFQYLSMSEAYLNFTKLTRYELKICNSNIRSQIFKYLIEGMRYLQNLDTFKIELQIVRIRDSKFFETLDEEVKSLKQLKDLSLLIGWGNDVTAHNMSVFSQTLMKLPQLEKLNIMIQLSNNGKSVNNLTNLEDAILFMKNLKELTFKSVGNSQISLLNLIQAFSQLPNLENTKLDFYISEPSQYESNLQQFAFYLSKIPSLTYLQTYFSYANKLSSLQMLQFIGEFKKLKKLKSLIINLSNQDKEGENLIAERNKDFIETISNLEVLQLSIYESINESYKCCGNPIIDAVSKANNLKELQLSFNSYQNNDEEDQDSLIQPQKFLTNFNRLEQFRLQLSFKYCFQTELFQQFFQDLAKNPIQDLQLLFNINGYFDTCFLQSLSESIQNFNQLINLELDFGFDNCLENEGFNYLNNSIKSLKNIERIQIEFSKKNISHENLIEFVSSFKFIEKLVSLELKIGGDSFQSEEQAQEFGKKLEFPQSIRAILIQMEIQDLTYKGLKYLFKNTSKQQKLNFLYFEFKDLAVKQEDLIDLRANLSQLKLLTEIDVRISQFNILYLVNLFDDLPFLEQIQISNYFGNRNYINIKLMRKVFYQWQNTLELQSDCKYNCFQENYKRCEKITLIFENDILFKPEDLPYYSWCFQNLSKITHLKLKILPDNTIKEEEADQLFKNMKYLVNLQSFQIKIHFQDNFNTDCLVELGRALLLMKLLRILRINLNLGQGNTDLEGMQFINGVSSLSCLEDFKFKIKNYYDSLTEQGFQTLCQEVSKMNRLRKLMINISLIEFDNLNQIESMNKLLLQQQSNLIYLELYFNRLQLALYDNINLFYKNLLQLQNLQVINTYSDGIFNKYIYKLKRLVSVNFKESNFY